MVSRIKDWIKNYAVESGISTLVVGISGGIDSALVSTLCAMTGMEVVVVSIPIRQKEDQLLRSRNHAKWLCENFNNVKFVEKDLTEIFNLFTSEFEDTEKNNLSLANSRSRLRMITLYQIATSMNGLVVGTGNKIEDFGVGFFTKYGDGGVDISPIADLTKTEVRKLSKELNIDEEIIIAKPTDGLWDEERTDEDQLGASYEELEWAMDFIERDLSTNLSDRQGKVLEIYKFFNKKNKHKMVSIPIFKNNN